MNSAPLHPVGSDRPRLVRRPIADHSPAEARALCTLIDTVWPRDTVDLLGPGY